MVKKSLWRRWRNLWNVSRSSQTRRHLRLDELESRDVPAAVQFSTASETVSEAAGTFSIPVTLTGTVQPTVSTFATGFDQPDALALTPPATSTSPITRTTPSAR
jgi:hypothetical protein